MTSSVKVYNQIKDLTAYLIGQSLCNDQQFPTLANYGKVTEISFPGAKNLGNTLKNVAYSDIYAEMLRTHAYSVRMIDGALLQLMYRFHDEKCSAHRLAFFPSPDLGEFQNNPDIYEADEIYADILAKNIVTFPVRFDYDDDDALFVELHHPKSHLTLGQYKNCRIPVNGPLSPRTFLDFILRSFYNTAHRKYCEDLPKPDFSFDETIVGAESKVMHVFAPRH
ncbi:DUF2290 domain-containing protein [Pseudoduganella chitinolytica]|uniref:DUF2290 domain-containing protein n=1 Tax=Pseudoduganella chitinolytica TaxID=34070 RepID=A0ABY8B841_9BURK|nr:DUF2290 domain-containing protein [Pseudoduganella chitinolytica]WEF30922.1 DUF2290 domain-containing protein [Pseudoduganella chitinolytica]